MLVHSVVVMTCFGKPKKAPVIVIFVKPARSYFFVNAVRPPPISKPGLLRRMGGYPIS